MFKWLYYYHDILLYGDFYKFCMHSLLGYHTIIERWKIIAREKKFNFVNVT